MLGNQFPITLSSFIRSHLNRMCRQCMEKNEEKTVADRCLASLFLELNEILPADYKAPLSMLTKQTFTIDCGNTISHIIFSPNVCKSMGCPGST